MTPDDTYQLDFDTAIKDMGVEKSSDIHSTKNIATPEVLDWQRETLGTIMEMEEPSGDSHNNRQCPVYAIAGMSPFDPEEPNFTLGESLGVGGMGAVHAATQSFMEREIALKRSHHAEGKGSTFDSVIEEGRRFGRLDHPSIPPVHMVGKDAEGHAVLVMKRIDGTDLHSMLKNPDHVRWSDVEEDRTIWVLDILIQISRALEHAHSRWVLHRDIKTENVMIGDFGQTFLIDWGISIDLRDKEACLTTGKFVGTPCFAAPEMVQNGGSLRPATDVYLLGAMLFEIMTGKVPHQGRSIDEILEKAKNGHRPNIPASIPPALASIIGKALEPEIEDRYNNATEFRLAVQRYKADHFLLEQLRLAEQQIATLRHWRQAEQTDRLTGYNFMTLAHEALAILKTVIRGGVQVQYAEQLVVENIRIQAEYSILNNQFGVARSLIAKLVDELGPNVEWINTLAGQIAEAQSIHDNRDAELRTQSLAVMFEKMFELQRRNEMEEE